MNSNESKTIFRSSEADHSFPRHYYSSSSANSTERHSSSSKGASSFTLSRDPDVQIGCKSSDWYQESLDRMEESRRRFEEEVQRKRDEFFRSSSVFPHAESLVNSSGSLPHSRLSTDKLSPLSGSHREPQVISPMGPSALVPLLSASQFERDDSGQLMFRLRFDVSDFDIDNIRVTTKDERLTVTAKKDVKSLNSCSTKEFTHTMDLPSGVSGEEIACKLTDEGVLVLSAPVISRATSDNVFIKSPTLPVQFREDSSLHGSTSPRYSSPQVAIENNYKSSRSSAFPNASSDLGSSTEQLSSSSFPVKTIHLRPSTTSPMSAVSESGSIITLADGTKQFRLCVELSDDYEPHEISVKTNEHKLFVHAKHEERSLHRTVLREFTKDFDIPFNVDPQMITAKFKHGFLVLSAPISSAVYVSNVAMM